MHCSRGGHDRVEMRLMENGQSAEAKLLVCPICGRQEKLYGRLASVSELKPDDCEGISKSSTPKQKPRRGQKIEPIRGHVNELVEIFREWWDGGAPPRRLLNGVREWWNGGEPILVLLDAISEDDSTSTHIATLPKLVRNTVALDRSERMVRVGHGSAIPISDVEVAISRRLLIPASWLETPIGRAREKWIYEVYLRHGTQRTLVAEYGSRAGAERGARNLREDLVLPA